MGLSALMCLLCSLPTVTCTSKTTADACRKLRRYDSQVPGDSCPAECRQPRPTVLKETSPPTSWKRLTVLPWKPLKNGGELKEEGGRVTFCSLWSPHHWYRHKGNLQPRSSSSRGSKKGDQTVHLTVHLWTPHWMLGLLQFAHGRTEKDWCCRGATWPSESKRWQPPDWPLNVPRTVTWICRFIDRRGGGGPNAYHQWWQQSKFLKSDTPAVKLHGLLCEALEFAATYDCLDVTNLVCFERLLREVQQIEHDYRDAEDGHHSGNRGPSNGGKAGSGSLFDQGAVFSGLSRDKGQIMCCPSLLEYIASDLAISTNVQKQLRKADEERAFARKNKKAPQKDKDEK